MGLINFLKNIFGGPKKITPEYLAQQYSKLGIKEYVKWIKKQLGFYYAVIVEQREKTNTISQDLITSAKLIEDEIEKLKTQGASHLFKDSKLKIDDLIKNSFIKN